MSLPRWMALIGIPAVLLVGNAALADNTSLFFDGVNDYVNVPDAMDLQGAFTFEAWIKVDADPSGGRILSNRNAANGYEWLVYADAGVYHLWLAFNGNLYGDVDISSHVGVWTHVAAVWAGPPNGVYAMYVGGVSVQSGPLPVVINTSTGPLRIGSMGSGGSHFHGAIDEVRIWSAALDGADIASWMSRPVTADHPNYTDLEGYWNFDEGSGQTAQNLAGDPGRDGRLGSSPDEDGSDPQWQAEGAPVPVNPATVGQLKQRFLRH
jgi:hypothetical protein